MIETNKIMETPIVGTENKCEWDLCIESHISMDLTGSDYFCFSLNTRNVWQFVVNVGKTKLEILARTWWPVEYLPCWSHFFKK